MIRRGRGLRHFPAGPLEQRLRAERIELVAEARKRAKTIRQDGRVWKLVQLPNELGPPRDPDDTRVKMHRARAKLLRDRAA